MQWKKGSNPWGCTDYLNQKKKILKTGADVYELMNDYPVHTKAVLIDDHLSVVVPTTWICEAPIRTPN